MVKGDSREYPEKNKAQICVGTPVFCDNCPTLAFVSLDDSPLCHECLARHVADKDSDWIIDHVSPLDVKPIQTTPLMPEPRDDDSSQVA